MGWISTDTELSNETAVLRPMRAEDLPDLRAIAFEREIWEYFVVRVDTEKDLKRFVDTALLDMNEGRRLVFTIRDSRGQVAGSMAFGGIAPADRRIEIGWSWLGKAFRGTKINIASKVLLLDHAFSSLECERVEFKTDALNVRARAGLTKLGAKEEGTLRSYNLMPDGRRRNAVFYSIIRAEWPEVRQRLMSRLKDVE